MEFKELLNKRRSIRSYEPEGAPTKEEVEKLIASALEAPSWKNTETGRYYCVLSASMQEEVRKCLPDFNAERTQNAAYIVTSFVKDLSGYNVPDHTPCNELGNGWGCYDLGLQTQNLLLAAAEAGFGTLVMGIRDAQKLRTLLSVPETETIVSVIAIGRSTAAPAHPKRKETTEVARFY